MQVPTGQGLFTGTGGTGGNYGCTGGGGGGGGGGLRSSRNWYWWFIWSWWWTKWIWCQKKDMVVEEVFLLSKLTGLMLAHWFLEILLLVMDMPVTVTEDRGYWTLVAEVVELEDLDHLNFLHLHQQVYLQLTL